MTPVDVIIEKWMHVREATGANDGADVLYFTRGDKVPWCAAFILRAIEAAGWPKPPCSEQARAQHGDRWGWYYENRRVAAWLRNTRAAGALVTGLPERNDLVFYGARAGSDESTAAGQMHIDIVESVETDVHPSPVIHVIGGNLGNAVRRRVVSVGDPRIVGIGRLARPA